MLKAVLFDLDGTLVPLDQNEFVAAYLGQLAPRMAGFIDTKRFVRQLLASTEVMVANLDPRLTNEQVFLQDFFANIGLPEKVLMPVFDDFYEHHFGKVSCVARKSDHARRAVQAVLKQGLDVVVATNPVFPLTAIRKRLSWNSLADLPFTHITSYETSHFCKPNIEYYLEIAERLGVNPEECLMVGNDVEEDLAAAKVGMKVYLVTDCLLNSKNVAPDADYSGTLTQLADFLASSKLAFL